MSTIEGTTAAHVSDILEHVAGEWTTEQTYPHYVKATRADGLELGFHVRTYGAGAGKCEVSYVPARHDSVRYNETRPSIGVTINNDARKVGADIARRLMPAADEFHALMLERDAAHNAWETAVQAGTARLIEATGVGSYKMPENDEFRTPSGLAGHGRVRVSSDTAWLELSSVPHELAERILETIRDYNGNNGHLA